MTGSAAWVLDHAGYLSAARHVPSSNCDDRPDGSAIELLVVHNISLPPGKLGGSGIVDLFTNRRARDGHPYYRDIADAKVSSHFLIRRDLELIHFLPCNLPAWHAGQS